MIDGKKIKELLLVAVQAGLQAGSAIMEVYNSDDFEITRKTDLSPLTLADRKAHDVIQKALNSTGFPLISEEGLKIDYNIRKEWEYFWLVDPLDGTKEFIKRNGEFTVNIALINRNKPVMGVVFEPAKDILYFGSEETGSFKFQITNYELRKFSTMELLTGNSERLPLMKNYESVTIIASRSHTSLHTIMYINKLKKHFSKVNIVSKGSSLKLCMIAEGSADVYPRFSPTMEWDTAAGHALVKCSGGKVLVKGNEKELEYNRENMLNPSFTAYREGFDAPMV
jgi:3'(2'), 5'-bisphosphate nucleotidase